MHPKKKPMTLPKDGAEKKKEMRVFKRREKQQLRIGKREIQTSFRSGLQ